MKTTSYNRRKKKLKIMSIKSRKFKENVWAYGGNDKNVYTNKPYEKEQVKIIYEAPSTQRQT